ncbi:hypothetical protein ACFWY9_15080 [Amycolatopsis sp. NPDC059027]|uniref:hypothetical protein n=1 Tax=unclassified Amycolatopsis TaxID=2618356 RepID=UPI0036717559
MGDFAINNVKPRREWLVRCSDGDRRTGVCSVEANKGSLGVCGPDGALIALSGREIIDFRAALDAAIAQVEEDLRTRGTVA